MEKGCGGASSCGSAGCGYICLLGGAKPCSGLVQCRNVGGGCNVTSGGYQCPSSGTVCNDLCSDAPNKKPCNGPNDCKLDRCTAGNCECGSYCPNSPNVDRGSPCYGKQFCANDSAFGCGGKGVCSPESCKNELPWPCNGDSFLCSTEGCKGTGMPDACETTGICLFFCGRICKDYPPPSPEWWCGKV